jgi:hypothetical protein
MEAQSYTTGDALSRAFFSKFNTEMTVSVSSKFIDKRWGPRYCRETRPAFVPAAKAITLP